MHAHRTHRTVGATLLGAALILLVLVVTAAAAAAGTGPGSRGDRNRRIAFGDIRVAAGEVVDGPLIGVDDDTRISGTVDGRAFVLRGDLVVTAGGTVDGDVVVVRGDARIDGRVDGNVVVLGGRAVVNGDAVVRGDVSSTRAPRVARGARVTGDIDHIDLPGIIAALGAGLLLFWWVAVTVSTAVLGAILLALLPRGFEAAAAVGRDGTRWWIAVFVGVGLAIAFPVVGILALISLVGLPLGLGLLGALGLIHAVGYIAGAHFLGRVILKPPKNRFGAFFVGWAILRAVALVPGLGVLVWIAAAVYGLGMLALAGFTAGQMPRGPAAEAAAPAPVEPTAPAAAPVSTAPETTT